MSSIRRYLVPLQPDCPAGGYHHAGGQTDQGAATDSSPVPDKDGSGTEPDARFTLANERTFLAWSRTALALIAAGLAVAQLLPPFPRVPWGRSVIATPLILLGAVLSGLSYFEWKRNQRALRHGESMPHTLLPKILALTVGAVALIAAAVDLYSKASGH
jgi:putative membrane protein